MFMGSINIVDDLNLAIQCSGQGCKVIYIGELNNNLPPQFITCPMLLPPYEALNAEVDGNMQLYNDIYCQHLNCTKECYDTFMTIIVSIFRGDNIIFYIENGSDLSHKDFLIGYFMNRFGILLGSENSNFSISPAFLPMLLALIYEFVGDKYIDPNYMLMQIDYNQLICIPQYYPFAGYLFEKLFADLGCANLEELKVYQDYLLKFKGDNGTYNLVIKEA